MIFEELDFFPTFYKFPPIFPPGTLGAPYSQSRETWEDNLNMILGQNK